MEKEAQTALKLRDEVARQYDVVPGKARMFFSGKLGRIVDLSKVTLAEAKELADAGYLIKKSDHKSPSKS